MENRQIAILFWNLVDKEEWDEMTLLFTENARIFWPNTNEEFDVDGYMRVKRTFPGQWRANVLRTEENEHGVVTLAKASVVGEKESLHAISFFTFCNGKICRLEEYWSKDSPAPEWRARMGIARPIEPIE